MELSGQTIGQYQILEEIGRGGMAVVYKAWQPSLNRYVALKVLPSYLTLDRQFVARFQREAQAAASLRHPNILVIHDVGQQGDLYYIVMEYLEGQTLKQLIEQQGPLPPERVVHIVEQVAEALDYAHQRGFVHRDIKPANIFVGQGDQVTLTDFGIAKAAWETHLTRTGMLVGTPEYMSPEQARGEEVDARSDLYSLGIVAYEMLTGRVPFGGTTPHAVLHQQIYEPPPSPAALHPQATGPVEAVLLRALAKKPEDRYPTAGGLAQALNQAVLQVEMEEIRRQVAQAAAWTAAGHYDQAISRLEALARTHPNDQEIAARLAEARHQAHLAHLYGEVRELWAQAQAKAEELLAVAPGYADPDGLLSRLAGRKPKPGARPTAARRRVQPWPWALAGLAVVAILVGLLLALSEGGGGRPTSASPVTGRIAFASSRDGNRDIYLMNADGSGLTRLTDHQAGDGWPSWSPDGKRIAFHSDRGGNWDIYVMNADGSGLTRLTNHPNWDMDPAWSPDGKRIAFASWRDGNRDIYVMNADGSGLTRLTDHPASDEEPAWSPDGKRIAFSSWRDGNLEICLINADGSGLTRLTNHLAEDWGPAWSSDGKRIAFISTRNGNQEIYLMNADGSGVTRLTDNRADDQAPAWSPDRKRIAFASDRDGNWEIYVMNADGSGLTRLTNNLAYDYDGVPSWSPDGRRIAFDSNRDGNWEIYVMNADGSNQTNLTDNPSGDWGPSWSPR